MNRLRGPVTSVDKVRLIEPEELQSRLGEPNLLLIQVTSPEVYAQAHIAGAVLVTPGELVCGVPPASGRLPEHAALENLFSRIGYSSNSDVVVYDDEGGGWAGRFAWTLDVIGHRSWTYLNGGLHAWHGAGLPLETGNGKQPVPVSVTIEIDSGPIAEIEDVLATIEDPNQTVWDVRSAEEYFGLRQAAARVGHIPGAVNLDWERLKDPERHTRLRTDLEDVLAGLGLHNDKVIITHCQTHHRSGLSYMVGRLLGLNIRAYHGSWSEWGNRQDTPIELAAP